MTEPKPGRSEGIHFRKSDLLAIIQDGFLEWETPSQDRGLDRRQFMQAVSRSGSFSQIADDQPRLWSNEEIKTAISGALVQCAFADTGDSLLNKIMAVLALAKYAARNPDRDVDDRGRFG